MSIWVYAFSPDTWPLAHTHRETRTDLDINPYNMPPLLYNPCPTRMVLEVEAFHPFYSLKVG